MRAKLLTTVLGTLLGVVAVALVTLVCFRLGVTLAIPLCLDLIVIVLLSLGGSFKASAVVSIVAVGCLDYYFTRPLFSALILDPVDIFAVVLFLVTAAVITTLVSRLRGRAEELASTNVRVEQQVAELRLAQDQLTLARANRVMLMGEMTASIAHEVNQPLTGILANAGTALRYLGRDLPDLAEVRHCLGLIARDGKRAAEIITRIRALAKKSPPRAELMDVNEPILEAIALTDRELRGHGVELEVALADDLPPVPVDRVQLQQVVLNLVVNAIEAMSDVGNAKRRLTVTSGRSDTGEVLVEVRDLGPGIDPAALDRMFASFYTTKSEGMGMGLSISRSIVEAHGGRLWATPNEPRGAAFRFTLPAEGE